MRVYLPHEKNNVRKNKEYDEERNEDDDEYY